MFSFARELLRESNMLPRTSTTSAKKGTLWFDAKCRGFENVFDLSSPKGLLLLDVSDTQAITGRSIRDKDSASLFVLTDAFAAVGERGHRDRV
tara:strand:+ start:251 stop:529 length:279 start_codon:yes stop_codon:yes gene_type:complete